MEMKQIIMELEGKLREERIQMEDLEKKVNFWMAALDSAEKEMKTRKDNVSSLEMMIEAAKEGHFGLKEAAKAVEEAKPVEETVKAENKAKKETVERIDARHRGAFVIKVNQYDNVEDRFKSQKIAARELHWDQSSVCKFMKLGREEQLRRKGFALLWEY